METKEILSSGKSFFIKCKRVWHSLRKPNQKEFLMVTKVSAIGILAIGVLGFVISIAMNLFF